MTKNGIMVITGNSIQELEADLQAMKAAMATGAQSAVGGTSVADVEKGLKALKTLVDEDISSKATEHSCTCCCESGCGCCEDEDEDENYSCESADDEDCEDEDEIYEEGYEAGRDECYAELRDDMELLVELIKDVGVKKVLAALIGD